MKGLFFDLVTLVLGLRPGTRFDRDQLVGEKHDMEMRLFVAGLAEDMLNSRESLRVWRT